MKGNQRGVVLMVLAMGGFALEDMFIKLMSPRVPPGQILVTLGLFGALLFAGLAHCKGTQFWSRTALHPAVMGRNVAEMLGTFGYVLAVALSPLTTATAIFQATPLAVTMGAALFLGEAVGWRRWTAIGVGFVGVMMVVRPGAEGFAPTSLFSILAVIGLSARDLFTRRIPPATDSLLLAGWGFVAVGLVGAVQLLVTGGAVRPTDTEGLWLLGALIFGSAGYWTLTEATRAGDIAAVVPFRYSRLLFALVIGIAIFGERPDGWTIAGSVLIIASGLYAFARERARGQAGAITLSETLPTPPANV